MQVWKQCKVKNTKTSLKTVQRVDCCASYNRAAREKNSDIPNHYVHCKYRYKPRKHANQKCCISQLIHQKCSNPAGGALNVTVS